MCADVITPCHFQGCELWNGKTCYRVLEDRSLLVTQGKCELSRIISDRSIGDGMSINLVLKRNEGFSGTEITLTEWQNMVAADAELRMSVQPVQVRNPQTGELIHIARAQGVSEIHFEEQWIPFLEWRRGMLTCRYSEEMDAPENPIRLKIVNLSRRLHASIFVDVQDEPLKW
jgi:hypothetical protein